MATNGDPGDSSATAQNRELVAAAFERFARGDVSGIVELLAEDAVAQFPEGTFRGADVIAKRIEEEIAMLSGWHLEVLALAAEGDDVLIRWILTGTHAGGSEGILPTGKPVTIHGAEHLVVRDGRTTHVTVILDRMAFAEDIGMIPPSGTPGDRVFKAFFNVRTKVDRLVRRVRPR